MNVDMYVLCELTVLWFPVDQLVQFLVSGFQYFIYFQSLECQPHRDLILIKQLFRYKLPNRIYFRLL